MELSTYRNTYKGEIPPIRQRKIVGYFSVNTDGEPYCSTEQLGYLKWKRFYRKKISINLTRGQSESIRRTEKHDFSYYQYMVDNPSLVHNFSANNLDQVGFICNRQILRRIANLPYQDQRKEVCSALLYQGNIYLYFIKNDEPANQRMEQCSRWGYKFEQHLLSSTPNSEPITDTPVKEGEEFACIYESTFGKHRVLYAAEMDGIIIENDEESTAVPSDSESTNEEIIKVLNTKKFVELKTSGYDENHGTFRKFKSREIWSQSHFTGVETIIIGIRNYDGIVHEIRRYHTQDLIEIGRESWNPQTCLNFLDSFLSFVKKCFARELPSLKQDSDIKNVPSIELIFERKVNSPVTLSKKKLDAIRPHAFDWFIKGISVKTEK